jgi:hypothetical protein
MIVLQGADIACTHGVEDLSGFTLFEIIGAPGHGAPPALGHRYMEALAYFRTGKKGLVMMKHAEDEA